MDGTVYNSVFQIEYFVTSVSPDLIEIRFQIKELIHALEQDWCLKALFYDKLKAPYSHMNTNEEKKLMYGKNLAPLVSVRDKKILMKFM